VLSCSAQRILFKDMLERRRKEVEGWIIAIEIKYPSIEANLRKAKSYNRLRTYLIWAATLTDTKVAIAMKVSIYQSVSSICDG
jgi:hypothetical protein